MLISSSSDSRAPQRSVRGTRVRCSRVRLGEAPRLRGRPDHRVARCPLITVTSRVLEKAWGAVRALRVELVGPGVSVMEIQEAVVAVRRVIMTGMTQLRGVVGIGSAVMKDALLLIFRHATRSSARAVISFAAAKIVLQRLSAVARGDSLSLGRGILSGIFAGLGFVAGVASAACLAMSLSSKRAKLGGAKGVVGVALLFFLVMHVGGRSLVRPHQDRIAEPTAMKVTTSAVNAPLRASPTQAPPSPRAHRREPPSPKAATRTVDQPQDRDSSTAVVSRSSTAAPVSSATKEQKEAQRLLQHAEKLKLKAEQLLAPPSPTSGGETAGPAAVPESTPPSSPSSRATGPERSTVAEGAVSPPGTPWQMVEHADQEPEEAHEEAERPPAQTAPPVQVQQEVFVDPSVEELHAQGEWLIGRRVSVEGFGPGTVIGFLKTYGRGASRHVIKFDQYGQEVTVKLARKTNTDPQKKPWKVVSPVRKVR